jgi:hypothetical protein
MPNGVTLPKKVRSELDAMRLEHKLSFTEIGRLAGISNETARKAIKEGHAIRDFHQHALVQLLGKYRSGALKFEDGKGVEVLAVQQ